jgi:hypothetical protein
MSIQQENVGGKKPGRPTVIYALVLLQVVVGILMIEGFQGLFVPGSLVGNPDDLNVGFILGIIDLILIAPVWLGKGWGRGSVVAFAVIGVAASILGSVQAYLNNIVTTATTVGPDLPIIPVVVEVVILYLTMRPASKAYFSK